MYQPHYLVQMLSVPFQKRFSMVLFAFVLVLPSQARVDQEAMAMKEYLIFRKAPALFGVIYPGNSLGVDLYNSAEIQSVYSAAPTV